MREVSRRNFLWLDSVPADWEIRPLFALGHENKKLNKDLSEQNLLSLSYGEIVEKDINSEDGLLPASFASYQVVEPGTMIFRFTDLQNDHTSLRSGLVKSRGIITNAYLGFVPKRISSRFLFYLMRALDNNKVFYGMGSGLRQSLTWDDARRIPVLAPSLEEQNEIVSYLDEETSQIDQLISKKEQLIEKLLERRQALITQAVTKGLDPNVPMKDSGVEWLGEVPRHWRVRRLGELGRMVNGHPFDSEAFDSEGAIPLVRIRDIGSNEFSTFLRDGTPVPSLVMLREGDIVIGMDGDFNAVYWSKGSAALNQRLCYLRFSDELLSAYVSFAVRDPLKFINDLTYSTTVKHLSSGQVSKISIAIPPPEELHGLSHYLQEQTSSIDALVHSCRTAIQLLKERRQALITQVVTGKIDVRGFDGGNS